ncbi:MAG: DUF1015 domain-containing protein [Firmicutes bacterium]|jgi:uncharacterized protein (DUF1015 family)|nr:DUF1015 domain-containing protein [Bacillota bacterium]
MAKLMPFRAVYYDPHKVGADLGAVIAPPYDVVDAEEGRRLADRHPWNVVRLELTIPPPGGQDPALYENAAKLWRAWCREGVLVADSEPSLYLCEHEFEWQGTRYTRRAVMGLLDLSEGVLVLPHEETMAHAKEDRMNLLRASHALPSPMLGLYEDPFGRVASTLACMRAASGPDLAATLPAEALRVWRVRDEPASAAIMKTVGSGPVVIADGHHRCESMKRLARETGNPKHMRIMAALVSISDPGVVVLPTHRVIAGWPEGSEASLVERVLSAFDVIDTRPFTPGSGEDGVRRLWTWLCSQISCSDGKTSFAVATRANMWILAYDGDTPEMLRRLDLEIAEEAVSCRKAAPDAACEVAYTHNGPAELAAIASGRMQVAVFPPAIPASEILKKAREGYLFPRKTTYFLPKAPAGLLMWDLDD